MRVLLVHNRYRSVGGEERHIDLLEAWLPHAGVEVRRFEVVSPSSLSLPARAWLGATLTYRPAGARLLRKVLERDKPDIVHFHNIFPLLTPAALREAHRFGVPVVLTVHNYRFACPAGTLLRQGRIHEDCIEGSSLVCGLRNARGTWGESVAYGMALELQRRMRLLQRWVDAYVAPSHFVSTMLTRAGYPRERVHTIYHFAPLADAPSRAGDFALYVGRLSPEKGIETLLAARRLDRQTPLVVAGDGPLAPLVQAEAGNGLTYLGHVDSERAAELRRDALFTLMPSECYEGQPFGALESMGVGTPLVASRLGGLAEIIEDWKTGLLVPPGDPYSLTTAIRAMWADKNRAFEMGAQAWSYAQEHFAPTTQIERLVALYEQVIVRRAQSHCRDVRGS